jgi:CRISPR-associated protein Cst2
LADISPKFIACALTSAKVPIFLESVIRDGDELDINALTEALDDSKGIVAAHCFGARTGLFEAVPEGCKKIGEAFDTVRSWIRKFYGG